MDDDKLGPEKPQMAEAPTGEGDPLPSKGFDIAKVAFPPGEAGRSGSGAFERLQAQIERDLARDPFKSAAKSALTGVSAGTEALHANSAYTALNLGIDAGNLATIRSVLSDLPGMKAVSDVLELTTSGIGHLPRSALDDAIEAAHKGTETHASLKAAAGIDASLAASAAAMASRRSVIDNVHAISTSAFKDMVGAVGAGGAFAEATKISAAIDIAYSDLGAAKALAATKAVDPTALKAMAALTTRASIDTAAFTRATALLEASAHAGMLDKARLDAIGVVGMIDHQAIMGGGLRSAIDQIQLAAGGPSRDSIFGALSAVGSLTPLASQLSDSAPFAVAWTERFFGTVRDQIASSIGGSALRDILSREYAEIFPKMRWPTASEISEVVSATSFFAAESSFPDWAARTRVAIEGLSTPWVLADQSDISIAALSRLTALEGTVIFEEPSGRDMADALRLRLGDYRRARKPSRAITADPVSRSAYQLDRGFDPTLSLLPTAVVATMFAPIGMRIPAGEPDADHLENMLRMMLKRIEQAIRAFIVAHMQTVFGKDWFNHVPSAPRRSWSKKRQEDIDEGRKPGELIDYADIDDYRAIIESPEIWKAVFEPIFKDQLLVRESLRRIGVVRNPNAHFRTVTVEDLIIIRAEMTHLGRWMRIGDGQ